jgi:hypothetical protein
MKRDKKFVVFIVFISIAITGVLQYTRSPGTSQIVPYLTAMESSLCEFGEEYTNEFYSFNSQLKPDIENSIPVGYFVEEQRIIEEFTNEKQIKPILCRYEPRDYMSLTNGMRLVTDLFIFDKITQLQKRDEVARETTISEEDLIFRMASNIQNTHIIRANDNLYNLSKKYYKDESKWTMIYEANKNKMSDPHSLQIGQELLIPDITVPNKENRNNI